MTYNSDGSEYWNLARKFDKLFDDKFKKVKGAQAFAKAKDPTREEKTQLAQNVYKISSEQLGRIVRILDENCERCIDKSSSDDSTTRVMVAMRHAVTLFTMSVTAEKLSVWSRAVMRAVTMTQTTAMVDSQNTEAAEMWPLVSSLESANHSGRTVVLDALQAEIASSISDKIAAPRKLLVGPLEKVKAGYRAI